MANRQMDPGRSILAEVMAGSKAPGASQPGRGTGNITYAKGMMSGQFGPKPPDRAAPPTPQPEPAPAPGPAPAPQGNGGQPPPMAAPPPGSGNPFLFPMFYFEIMGSIMQALTQAADTTEGPY